MGKRIGLSSLFQRTASFSLTKLLAFYLWNIEIIEALRQKRLLIEVEETDWCEFGQNSCKYKAYERSSIAAPDAVSSDVVSMEECLGDPLYHSQLLNDCLIIIRCLRTDQVFGIRVALFGSYFTVSS